MHNACRSPGTHTVGIPASRDYWWGTGSLCWMCTEFLNMAPVFKWWKFPSAIYDSVIGLSADGGGLGEGMGWISCEKRHHSCVHSTLKIDPMEPRCFEPALLSAWKHWLGPDVGKFLHASVKMLTPLMEIPDKLRESRMMRGFVSTIW